MWVSWFTVHKLRSLILHIVYFISLLALLNSRRSLRRRMEVPEPAVLSGTSYLASHSNQEEKRVIAIGNLTVGWKLYCYIWKHSSSVDCRKGSRSHCSSLMVCVLTQSILVLLVTINTQAGVHSITICTKLLLEWYTVFVYRLKRWFSCARAASLWGRDSKPYILSTKREA